MNEEFDLFGEPVKRTRKGRGRPKHVRDEEKFKEIMRLKAAGVTHEGIAAAVGLSENTMREYYLRALDHGSALAKAEVVAKLAAAADRGVVGAMRSLYQIYSEGDLRPQAPGKPERLGKKAQLIEEARVIPDGWDGLLTPASGSERSH